MAQGRKQSKAQTTELDFATPLEQWAFSVHELVQALISAGFKKQDALWLAEAKSPLPDWLFPEQEDLDDDFEVEE